MLVFVRKRIYSCFLAHSLSLSLSLHVKQLPVPLTSRLPINKFSLFFFYLSIFLLSKVNSLRRINNEFRRTSGPLSPSYLYDFFFLFFQFLLFSKSCYAQWIAHQVSSKMLKLNFFTFSLAKASQCF